MASIDISYRFATVTMAVILYRFRNKARYSSNNANFSYPFQLVAYLYTLKSGVGVN